MLVECLRDVEIFTGEAESGVRFVAESDGELTLQVTNLIKVWYKPRWRIVSKLLAFLQGCSSCPSTMLKTSGEFRKELFSSTRIRRIYRESLKYLSCDSMLLYE